MGMKMTMMTVMMVKLGPSGRRGRLAEGLHQVLHDCLAALLCPSVPDVIRFDQIKDGKHISPSIIRWAVRRFKKQLFCDKVKVKAPLLCPSRDVIRFDKIKDGNKIQLLRDIWNNSFVIKVKLKGASVAIRASCDWLKWAKRFRPFGSCCEQIWGTGGKLVSDKSEMLYCVRISRVYCIHSSCLQKLAWQDQVVFLQRLMGEIVLPEGCTSTLHKLHPPAQEGVTTRDFSNIKSQIPIFEQLCPCPVT